MTSYWLPRYSHATGSRRADVNRIESNAICSQRRWSNICWRWSTYFLQTAIIDQLSAFIRDQKKKSRCHHFFCFEWKPLIFLFPLTHFSLLFIPNASHCWRWPSQCQRENHDLYILENKQKLWKCTWTLGKMNSKLPTKPNSGVSSLSTRLFHKLSDFSGSGFPHPWNEGFVVFLT